MFEASRYRPALIEAIPYPLLFASVSGAHLYGFPSPDSDVDLRACHVLPVKAMLGLSPPKGTVSRTWIADGVEIDLVSHDLVKYVVMLLEQHGNYLEQLFAPLVVLDTPWAEELRDLVRQGTISRHAYLADAAPQLGRDAFQRGAPRRRHRAHPSHRKQWRGSR